jgi:hypothetical protein
LSQDRSFAEQDAPGATYLTLPDTIDPGIRALARRITADADSPAEKAAAVTRHLVGRHDYATNVSVPLGEDPLAWFLLSEPAVDAHCEYFAAAATVLLRAANVPTRYVTGVLVHEQHPWADYWVARNRDAHAWCEAWDAEAGRWFLVEATPASARPDEAAPDASLADSLRDQLGMWWAKLRARAENLRETLTVTTVTAAVLICVAMLVSAFALRYVLRRKRNKRTSSSGPLLPEDRLRARIARLGGELDAMVGRAGWERGRGEAPARYAARLLNSVPDLPTALPDAYYLYSRLRFGPLVSVGDCEALEKKIAEAAHGIQVLRRTHRNP